jgi:hypothetical protein
LIGHPVTVASQAIRQVVGIPWTFRLSSTRSVKLADEIDRGAAQADHAKPLKTTASIFLTICSSTQSAVSSEMDAA